MSEKEKEKRIYFGGGGRQLTKQKYWIYQIKNKIQILNNTLYNFSFKNSYLR